MPIGVAIIAILKKIGKCYCMRFFLSGIFVLTEIGLLLFKLLAV